MIEGMTDPWADPRVIANILAGCQTWAVVGLSSNTRRAAYGVSRFLQSHGKRIVPVHPRADTVHGEPGYPTLADIPFAVDCVDVFVRSELAGPVAQDAIGIGAKAVWFQLGVVDSAAFDASSAAGVDMVMDRCPVIEWPRHGPQADGGRK